MGSRGGSLAEIERAMHDGGSLLSGPTVVYVVSFDAMNRYPKKFLYRGCTREASGGWLCRKSVEQRACDHDPSGDWVDDMFRFDIFVTDASTGGRPLRASIFHTAAASLLQMTPAGMRILDEDQQVRCVQAVIHTWPKCEIVFKVLNRQVTVHSLTRVPVPLPGPRSTPSTPRRTTAIAVSGEIFSTPTGGTPPSSRGKERGTLSTSHRLSLTAHEEASKKLQQAAILNQEANDILSSKLNFLDLTGESEEE